MGIVVFSVSIMHPGNLGAIARLCDNYDVEKLVLVSPQCEITDEAYQRATHGTRFLDNAIIVDTLEEGKEHADLLIGLSARVGGNMSLARSSVPIQEIPTLVENKTGKIGFVLGSEDRGLTTEETNLCDFLSYIPLPGSNPVFNISHALSVALWEFIRIKDFEAEIEHRIMTREERNAFLSMVDRILPHTWLRENKHYGVQRVFQTLLGRSFVTKREAYTLIGSMRAIVRSLEGPHPEWDNCGKSETT